MMTIYYLIETMPEQHRASHRAADNWGRYPDNGAERLIVTENELPEQDEYDHLVRGATVKDRQHYDFSPAARLAREGAQPCTIHEAGNGLPQVGQIVDTAGEHVWRVLEIIGPIHTRQWEANYVHAEVAACDREDFDKDDQEDFARADVRLDADARERDES
jgi:hypothetical protein